MSPNLERLLTIQPLSGPDNSGKEFMLRNAAHDAVEEALRAARKFAPFNSAHEGYAIILEEMDELKAHVWTNQKRRDLPKMRAEAVQLAAMALRFIVDISDGGRGRV